MKKLKNLIPFLFIPFIHSNEIVSQTFFESADAEGVISFRNEKNVSQVKLNMASTAITYGYYFISGDNTKRNRFMVNTEVKLKPNEDGMATLVKLGKVQPGVKVNASLGYRRFLDGSFKVFDIYLKPEYSITEHTILDTTRISKGETSLYKRMAHSYGGNLVINFGAALFTNANIYIGVQAGILSTTNASDLAKGTFQNRIPVSDSASAYALSDAEQIKIGTLKSVTNRPLKVDLVFDSGLELWSIGTSPVRLGFFGYYRGFIGQEKNRVGAGLCFLNKQDPSKIFTSIGYELPENFGVDSKGLVFATIGFSIL